MSRRIAIFFLLAATTALTATQARADRECFENSCRLPGVVEPPPPSPPAATAEHSQAAVYDTGAEHSAEPAVHHPVPKPVPYVAKAPAPTKVVRGDTPPKPPVREIAPVAEARPVREATPAPQPVSYPRPAQRAPAAERSYAANERAARSGALILNVPAPYATEGVAPLQPYVIYSGAHAPRLYVLAPNAKIIAVDGAD